MGEAKRRRQQGAAPRQDIKIAPRKRAAGFLLVHHNRIEEEHDGVIYAQNVFKVTTLDGDLMVEKTPDGPRPVLLMSVPQPIRRASLVLVR